MDSYNDFSGLQKRLSTNFPDVLKIPGKTYFRASDFASIKKEKMAFSIFLKHVLIEKIYLPVKISKSF